MVSVASEVYTNVSLSLALIISRDYCMLNMNQLVGNCNFLFVTLDTLRFDAAQDAIIQHKIPNIAKFIDNQWEQRHTPGNFTYSAHHAFFAGFLPTPIESGKHPRLFATKFEGSESISDTTAVFDAPNVIAGFQGANYHTLCVGGVGFFNKKTLLSKILPDFFKESYWYPEFGVACADSTKNQVVFVLDWLKNYSARQPLFIFLNISAIHQPNRFYIKGQQHDNYASHIAALNYVDGHLPKLFTELQKLGDTFVILCSDHGTLYGEDGYTGHRIAHPLVWTVPYKHFFLKKVE